MAKGDFPEFLFGLAMDLFIPRAGSSLKELLSWSWLGAAGFIAVTFWVTSRLKVSMEEMFGDDLSEAYKKHLRVLRWSLIIAFVYAMFMFRFASFFYVVQQ